MRKICLQLFVFLAAPAILSGCLSGGTDAGGMPAPAAVIDESVLTAKDGSLATPYELPTLMPADTDGGVYDYLNTDKVSGYWQVFYSGLQVDQGTGVPAFGDLVYDQGTDEWLLTVDSTEYILKSQTLGYATNGCSAPTKNCAGFAPYVDPNKTLYGIFGYIGYDDKSTKTSVFVMHTGLKTQLDDMPSGTASYSGVFAGAIIDETTEYAALGTTTIDVDFGAAGDHVTFSSAGDVYDTSLALVGDYSLDGSATISGNTYTSTKTGITGGSTIATVEDSYTGELDAAFYGPDAVQTAGAVVTTSGTTGNVLAGGYWAEKQ